MKCLPGSAGCFCTPAGGCNDADLVCKDGRSQQLCVCFFKKSLVSLGEVPYCTRLVQDICELGKIGCPCVEGYCEGDNECRRVDGEFVCAVNFFCFIGVCGVVHRPLQFPGQSTMPPTTGAFKTIEQMSFVAILSALVINFL